MSIRSAVFPSAIVILALVSGLSWAEENERFHLSSSYKEECGSCHVAYPPQLLPPQSWKAVLAGLDKHFGSDASLEPAKAKEVGVFLSANADRSARRDAPGNEIGINLKITETPWFKHKHRDGHDGITAAVWKSPTVKRPSNCSACHLNASEGNYSEEDIRIPRTK